MNTWHIHISGMVQGVGFRPFVCRIAGKMNVAGWVSNTTDGVHIEFNAPADKAALFYSTVTGKPPVHALITRHRMYAAPPVAFSSFSIRTDAASTMTDLLITPDIALCSECKKEITDRYNSRRYGYAFTTCLQCGPRYSIITALPYDREHTTMAELCMCNNCTNEYHNRENRRHYSQTNSCHDCAIGMQLYQTPDHCISEESGEILQLVQQCLQTGGIVAVKGTGGYLLLADTANETAIRLLRTRKRRPQKPFAVLYPGIAMANRDVHLGVAETAALNSDAAPVVICRLKKEADNHICTNSIAPDLDTIGVMLPYTPLLFLLAEQFQRPLIATSANISGLPIVYKDADARALLPDLADLVLTFDREIVAPQDDSVVCFTGQGQRIVLRRSRGMSPGYLSFPAGVLQKNVLATGAELKSAFALSSHDQVLISQYLGNHHTLEAQVNYRQALQHVQQLLNIKPAHVLADAHPGYLSAQLGREIAGEAGASFTIIQHHKAHFAAVLAENNLLQQPGPVLGIVWDGAGYGEDGQVWGAEAFVYRKPAIQRVMHLAYFPQLLGDKMNIEPRLSALALLQFFPEHQHVLRHFFSGTEWLFYRQLLQQPPALYTSSMGRFLDAMAALLGITAFNTYEGEAVMKLETLALTAGTYMEDRYVIPVQESLIQWQRLIPPLLDDLAQGIAVNKIARKIFNSLAHLIITISDQIGVNSIACSGGVFQSVLLTSLLENIMPAGKQLYFHQELSPNDECIAIGQMACFQMKLT